jgi:hypothetical protein
MCLAVCTDHGMVSWLRRCDGGIVLSFRSLLYSFSDADVLEMCKWYFRCLYVHDKGSIYCVML